MDAALVIGPRVAQFISNPYRPRASRSSDFETVALAITPLIVSITKFSIVIGSPRAYLSRNRRAITLVSDNRCPI